MLKIIGSIMILVQFLMDAWAMKTSSSLSTPVEVLIWYLCGLIGLVLLLLDSSVKGHQVKKLRKREEEADED
ncbi:MAG: hypothetical protein VZT48_13275 [Bulleidia sp.]|nr:hypothetical protein [Bulleidia sp.]